MAEENLLMEAHHAYLDAVDNLEHTRDRLSLASQLRSTSLPTAERIKTVIDHIDALLAKNLGDEIARCG